MSDKEILSGWKTIELGEALKYEQPTPFIVESTDYNDEYETPVLTAGKSFIIGYTNEASGIYTNYPVIIFDDFTTATQFVNFPFKVKSSAMKILSAVDENTNIKLMYYLMQIIHCEHDTHKRYWISKYSKQKVTIPCERSAQDKIVSKIEELFSELDNGVRELKKIKAQLKVYRQAVLKNAFEGKPNNYWKAIKLKAVFVGTPQNGLYMHASAYGQGTQIIRIDGFYDGCILTDFQHKRLLISESDIERYKLKVNDLLINRVNSMPYLGKCGLVRNLSETTVFESNIMRIKLNTAICDPLFITYFLCSEKGKFELKKNAKQAVNQASINQTDVSNVELLLPSKDVQIEISCEIESRLSVCDKIEQTVDEALQKSDRLRQSILKKAFAGELVKENNNGGK